MRGITIVLFPILFFFMCVHRHTVFWTDDGGLTVSFHHPHFVQLAGADGADSGGPCRAGSSLVFS